MKAYRGSGGISPFILNLGTTWRCVVNFKPRPFYPSTHSTGVWVGKCAGLDVLEKRKISCPCRDSNPQPSNPQSSHCIDYANPVLSSDKINYKLHRIWQEIIVAK